MALSIGHTTKLNGIRHFSISRESCTHATPSCRLYCYGVHGHFLHPCVIKAYEENYEATKRDTFVEEMNKALSINERFFRIHAVGDFYNVEYFIKWCKIALDNPHITFMAYTRNPLVFEYPRPDNLRLLFSVDGDTRFIPKGARVAIVGPHDLKKGPHLEAIELEGRECRTCTKNDCIDCLACWLEDFNICFPQKYPKYDSETE